MSVQPVEIGAALWSGMRDAFHDIARINGFTSHEQKAQLWAGFLSASGGAMCAELVLQDGEALLEAVKNAVRDAMAKLVAH